MDPINNWLDNTTKKASEFLNAKIELLAFNYPNSLDVTFYLAATDRIIDLYKEKYSNDSISYFYDHVCDIIEKSLYILKTTMPLIRMFLISVLCFYFQLPGIIAATILASMIGNILSYSLFKKI